MAVKYCDVRVETNPSLFQYENTNVFAMASAPSAFVDATGENRDLRAGRCIGACLEYAKEMGQRLMIYVFSDSSLTRNGVLDGSAAAGVNLLGGRGKGQWTGDNSSTACSFFLVFNPGGNIQAFDTSLTNGRHCQIGRFSADGSVVTSAAPAANNVNLLVNTVVANYMALNNESGDFAAVFPNRCLGDIGSSMAFAPLT